MPADKALSIAIILLVSIIHGIFILPLRKACPEKGEKISRAAAVISAPLLIYAVYLLLS